MEVIGQTRIAHEGGSGITLKECSAIALLFFALQFTVLAVGSGHVGFGLSAAWLQLAANTAAAAGVVIAARLIAGDRFGASSLAGVGVVPVQKRSLLGCALSGLVLGATAVVLSQLFDAAQAAKPLLAQAYLEGGIPILVVWAVSIITVAPLGEELVCRGFILPALSGKIGTVAAVVVAALLFLSAHLPQINGYWVAAVCIFSLGMLAGIARVRTGSLFGAVAVHTGYNAVPLAYLLWMRFFA